MVSLLEADIVATVVTAEHSWVQLDSPGKRW